MKEEIEKILYDAEGVLGFNNEEATKELQRLFLSKQIELLNEVNEEGLDDIRAFISLQIRQFKEEIKSLE